ncbi:hypothetical protein Q5P01_000076 [Channa striata]|uniref:Uncharacterized protein n=1 Tax=Channa striata TaxID=64152 RepID=A0AA88IHS6_CHASR|nr:hypothetical protein Q5P01_000076 [Channa striata]
MEETFLRCLFQKHPITPSTPPSSRGLSSPVPLHRVVFFICVYVLVLILTLLLLVLSERGRNKSKADAVDFTDSDIKL